LAVQAAKRGHRVAFATAHQWVNRLGTAKRAGGLDEELERLGRIALLVVDEVGYIPFDPEAASLIFALISSRYERRSMIVSSNKTFSAWPEILGDPWRWRPWSTGSSTTPRLSCSRATATAYAARERRC
jgi:DNA replication protein DnaC